MGSTRYCFLLFNLTKAIHLTSVHTHETCRSGSTEPQGVSHREIIPCTEGILRVPKAQADRTGGSIRYGLISLHALDCWREWVVKHGIFQSFVD
jgi:hypothetical protein